jgi:hypothetical protein
MPGGRIKGSGQYKDDICFAILEDNKTKLESLAKRMDMSESDIYRLLIQKMIDNPLQLEKPAKEVNVRIRITEQMKKDFYDLYGKDGTYFLNKMLENFININY